MTALVWDGCVNVRDLGGLPTEGGARTQPGRVVRADNVRRLSEAGWAALVGHGVSRIVDLRFPEELAEDATREAPVEVVHISLLGESRTHEWQAAQNQLMDDAVDGPAYLVDSYADFLDRYRDRFAAAVRAVAAAPAGAVVIHCMGGKDRTGLLSALLLRTAGVSAAEVAADYALTEAALAARSDEWIAAADDEHERRRRTLLKPAPATVMRDVLAALEQRYGSVEQYLRGAGVSEAELARVRDRLVAP